MYFRSRHMGKYWLTFICPQADSRSTDHLPYLPLAVQDTCADDYAGRICQRQLPRAGVRVALDHLAGRWWSMFSIQLAVHILTLSIAGFQRQRKGDRIGPRNVWVYSALSIYSSSSTSITTSLRHLPIKHWTRSRYRRRQETH